jgi:hypothetical protein
VGDNPGHGSEVAPRYSRRDQWLPYLLEELIHEAVSVHSDSDIVIVIAVLGLHRIVYSERTCC